LGIQPNVCPPHRPDKNAFVERYHRTYNQESFQVRASRCIVHTPLNRCVR
jgi:hypothetical protein